MHDKYMAFREGLKKYGNFHTFADIWNINKKINRPP